MTRLIIAVEGLSHSGKTTFINHIISKTNFNFVPELIDFCGGPQNFPGLETTLEGAARNDLWFFEREVERCRYATNLAGNVIADRWFISGTAYSHARGRIFGNDIMREHLSIAKDYLKDRRLYMPMMVYVDTDIEKIKKRSQIQRALTAGDIPGCLMIKQYVDKFISYQKIFYDVFFGILGDSCLIVNSETGLEKNYDAFNNWIYSHKLQRNFDINLLDKLYDALKSR